MSIEPSLSPETQARPLRVVDLFSGAGGLSEGFRRAGFEIVAGTDIDPDAVATYSLNFPEARAFPGDVSDPEVREAIQEAAASVDVIVGGPPCQAFSQVRNHARLIDDSRNSLYREFVRVVADTLPPAFMMENVPGMAQMGVQDQVVQDLSLDGEYTVSSSLVDAADFGVPQTRKRLLFIGVRASLGSAAPILRGSGVTDVIQLSRSVGKRIRYSVIAREYLGEDLAQALADPFDITAVTAAQAISDLAHLSAGRTEDTLNEGLPPAESSYQKLMRNGCRTNTIENVGVPRVWPDTVMRLKNIPSGGNHRDLSEHLLERYLTGQKWGPHNGSGRMSRRHYYAYRRLHPNIWAWTLNTKADSVYHYYDARCLSVREFARLQAFPDSFTFITDPRKGVLPGRIDGGAAHSRYRQVGNAVPPLLALAAAQEILRLLRSSSLGVSTDDQGRHTTI